MLPEIRSWVLDSCSCKFGGVINVERILLEN